MDWLTDDDALYQDKRWLLHQLDLGAIDWAAADVSCCLAVARVLCLREAELPLLQSAADVLRPIGPRNEAAAIALLVRRERDVCGRNAARGAALHATAAAYAYADASSDAIAGNTFGPGTPEAELARHVRRPRCSRLCRLTPARFHGPGGSVLRGAAADDDMAAGAPALVLRASACVTVAAAARSSFGRALAALGLAQQPDALLLLWTMREREDARSRWRHTWAALPRGGFGTCLSAPAPLLGLAAGTPLHEEAESARAHVRAAFSQLQPYISALLAAYPQHLQPAWFSEAAYIWAVELWYAYAMELEGPDGERSSALVPLALLANHSAVPHCVDFSRLRRAPAAQHSAAGAHAAAAAGGSASGSSSGSDSSDGGEGGDDGEGLELALTPFRPLRRGQQLTLSYGPLPNLKLVTFYGFALNRNPHDEAELALPPPRWADGGGSGRGCDGGGAGGSGSGSGSGALLYAQLREQLCLPQSVRVSRAAPLPPLLLPALRLGCASLAELGTVQQRLAAHHEQGPGDADNRLQRAWRTAALAHAALGEPLSPDNEGAARRALCAVLEAARAPYAAALARTSRRRALASALAHALAPSRGGGAAFDEAAFMCALEMYCSGMVELFDAVAAAAQVHSCTK